MVPEVQKAEREDLMVVQEVIQLEAQEAPEDLPLVELVGHRAVQAAYPYQKEEPVGLLELLADLVDLAAREAEPLLEASEGQEEPGDHLVVLAAFLANA